MKTSAAILLHLGLSAWHIVIGFALVGFVMLIRTRITAAMMRWAAIGWSVCIFLGLSIPSSGLPDLTNRDKWLHGIIFSGFAYLWRRAGLSEKQTLLWGIIYGVVSEIYQAIMPIGRSGDWQDTAADIAGVLLGLLLARLAARLR
jgi:hypothetical protein